MFNFLEVMSVEWVKDLVLGNMAALNSGLTSAWVILKGNMSLLLSLISTLFSIVFGGGISVINFTLHSVKIACNNENHVFISTFSL